MAAPARIPADNPGLPGEAERVQFADDVLKGLCKLPKELPSKYLYDAVGSALFDVITVLPEYGLTRADERLLDRHAGEIAGLAGRGVAVVELGSGCGKKARPILEAITACQESLRYFAIDVSAAALDRCAQELAAVRGVVMHGVRRSYLEGLETISRHRSSSDRLLVLFLGSSIGNFDRREAIHFLTRVRELLHPGDALLLGADLVKPAGRLLAAYDDPAGVTAAFNLNLLGRINRELGGNFDLRAFRHEARWLTGEPRIEMHLRSLRRQTVTVAGAACRVNFEPGETIWTESSHKFGAEELLSMAARSGFHSAAQWVDDEWPFAECLWRVDVEK